MYNMYLERTAVIKQRACRCLRSITDESLVLIELMIQLRCWGTEVLFTAPRASPRAGLGGNGPRQPSAGARAIQYSTVRTIQHTCKSSINRACVRRAVLSFLYPRFTTSVAWSATSNSMHLASSLGSGGWVSTSRDRVGTSCARPSWLDSQARGGRPSRRRERGLHSGNVYMCPLSAFLSLSLHLHASDSLNNSTSELSSLSNGHAGASDRLQMIH